MSSFEDVRKCSDDVGVLLLLVVVFKQRCAVACLVSHSRRLPAGALGEEEVDSMPFKQEGMGC